MFGFVLAVFGNVMSIINRLLVVIKETKRERENARSLPTAACVDGQGFRRRKKERKKTSLQYGRVRMPLVALLCMKQVQKIKITFY